MLGLLLLLPAGGIAQQSQESSAIIWWVVGTGGVLNAGNDAGDTLSATLGQTGIDSISLDEETFSEMGYDVPRSAMTAHLGFWLPRSTSFEDLPSAGTGTDNAYVLASYPNPFTDRTTISYLLPSNGHVRLRIFDGTGRQVRHLTDEVQAAGFHSSVWDGLDQTGERAAAGVYFYQLEVTSTTGEGDERASGTIYLVK
jgi:hypothetical protein